MIFDTETTGLPPQNSKKKFVDLTLLNANEFPYIVQLSYIIFNITTNQIVLQSDNILQLPDGVVNTPVSTEIHGLTDEMCKNLGVDRNAEILKIMDYIGNVNTIVCHNTIFDFLIIKGELIRFLNLAIDNNNATDKKIYAKLLNTLQYKDKHNSFCTMHKTKSVCRLWHINKQSQKRWKGKCGDENEFKWPKLSELHEHLFSVTPKNLHNSFNDVLICFRCYYFLKTNIDLFDTSEEFRQIFTPLIL
jgi:DNA polymerase III epsilon subunit-like protein